MPIQISYTSQLFTDPSIQNDQGIVLCSLLSLGMRQTNLLLGLEGTGEPALGEVVLDGPLLGGCALGESDGATEGTGEGGVLHAGNADVVGTANGAGAGHASGHLHGDGEVHGGSTRETANADAGNILGHLGLLEGSGVLATRGSVDGSGQGTGTVLVDLVEGHLQGAIILSGGQTLGGGHTSGGLDGGLLSALGGLGTAVGSTGQVGAAGEGLLVDGTGGLDSGAVATGAVHEKGHHLGGIDGATSVGAAQSGGLGSAELVLADDGGVGLGATLGRSAVTGSAVSDRETGQVHTVGTLDSGDDTVGEDIGGSVGRDEDGA